MTALVVPARLAGKAAADPLDAVLSAIGLPRSVRRHRPKAPRLVKEISRDAISHEGVLVAVWMDPLPVPVTFVAYPDQVLTVLRVGDRVRIAGLHATVEIGPMGPLGPLRVGLRCQSIGAAV